jgi:CheY-like chemotaxis protein
MKSKSQKLGSRQPKVVTIFENEDVVSGPGSILATHLSDYRTIQFNDDTTDFLVNNKPAVILFALSDVAKSIELYSTLVEHGDLDYPHYSILLCKNKESYLAFHCCMKGLFDNYFVYQPLYEKFRLLILVHNGLEFCQSNTDVAEFNGNIFEEIDEEIALLIDEGSRCKQNLLEKVNISKIQLTKVSDELGQQLVSPELSAQQIMSSITQEHVKPLLSMLENDINLSLDKIISQLVAQKIAFKTKSHQSEALINNSPPKIKHSEDFSKLDISALQQENETSQIIDTPPEKTVNTAPEIYEVKHNKILVVEDNALYRDMLVSVLQRAGFNVHEAQDGLKALQIIKEFKFDLIIMDLFMPNMDGLKATKKIHQISAGREVSVVALTGNTNKELIRKWARFGLKGYLIKPSTKEQILSTVHKVLSTAI